MAFGGQIIYGILIVGGNPSWRDILGYWRREELLKKKRISFDVSYTNAAQSEHNSARIV
jgi:hypothetical protein